MANDVLGFPYSSTGETLYALIRNDSGLIWDTVGSSFVTYVTANLGIYDVPLTEQGTASQFYTFTFPSAISAGSYQTVIYNQSGGSPAEGDLSVANGEIEWSGSILVAQTGNNFAKWTSSITESYASAGSAPTPEEALMMILQDMQERSFVNDVKTIKKLDGTTTAMTLTLNDPLNPSSISRTS